MTNNTKLVKILSEKKLTVATAESCTGGLISKLITDVSGSSDVFGFGLCTYANCAKEKLLGVKSSTLEKHGAVSSEVAREMAQGLYKLSGADIAISVTGIAGPSGGSDEKPVGLVYFGFAYGGKCESVKKVFTSDKPLRREEVRMAAAEFAINYAIEAAEKL